MNSTSLCNDREVLNLIVKTAGSLCNIACTYCFEQVKDVDVTALKPEKLEKTIQQIECSCSLVFHGGEPLIVGKVIFQEYLDIVKKYYPKKIEVVRIQTNGTLLDEEWMDIFFKKYKDLNIEIAISLDGNELMNQYRIDHNGNPTFSRVLEAFNLLNKYGKSAGMLSVISKPALPRYLEYVDLVQSIPNISFIKLNPLFNVSENQLTDNSITPSQYSEFVIKVSNEYIRRGLYNKFAMEPLLSILQRINGKKSRYCNYSNRKCYNYISIYPDGSLGPCDCLSVNSFYLGNIDNNLSINQQITNYMISNNSQKLKALLQMCDKCNITSFCQGGCLSQRYYFSGNKKLLDDFCKSKYLLYNAFQEYKVSK